MADNMNFEIKDFHAGSEDQKLSNYQNKLNDLRKDGVTKAVILAEDIASIRRDKTIDSEEKLARIKSLREGIAAARAVAQANAAEEKAISKEAVAYSNALYKGYEAIVVADEDKKIADAKEEFKASCEAIKKESADRISRINSSSFDNAKKKEEIEIAKYEEDSAIHEAKNKMNDKVSAAKAIKNQIYIDHVQQNRALRNGKTNFKEDMLLKKKNYVANFNLTSFFLANGLYIAIIIFFIFCIAIAPVKVGANLFTLPNIFTILEQSSTRMFYALGVAGLILLAGTDLSVGRMVALGSVVTSILLHPGTNIVTFFGMGPWNFDAVPMGVRVISALILSITLCVSFSAFAGFFTAKLKIHPFISTLSTQLIIYGLLFFGTSGTPTGTITASIKDAIGGRWILGVMNGQLITFPKLIIPAVIAIIVAWFIWNKTIFGKNMYAVGGNSEAAAVSGISVFKVTLGVFIMAGIFYGCGAFLEAFRANTSAGTGQGFELDAIAACVVGGISFNGGIGKIGGAVLGVIIFQGMTYALTFLGIDTNLQFVFKGVIIIAAVALDSVKYLKKK